MVERSHLKGRFYQDLAEIPRGIWALGFVSMFMDISSEMVHSLLPLFLVSVLGVDAVELGVLEGVSEAVVLVTKMASGTLSDWLGKRKVIALAGYGLAAITKPAFPLAQSFRVVFAARLVDRVGKGVRGAPRDALVADLTTPDIRGASYGLRQSLDTVGAIAGPLLATLLMLVSAGAFRFVFWIAVVPGLVSVAVMAIFVREPRRATMVKADRPVLQLWELAGLPAMFWRVVAIGAMFTVARFSEAFLILRAGDVGLATDYVPLILVVMNLVYTASAYPAGRISDRVDRRRVLAAGAFILVLSDLVLAHWADFTGLIIGVVLWGLHMGLSQGLLAALIADAAPAHQRGTAFGLFNLISGIALLTASLLAGELWQIISPAATFYGGALFAALAFAGLIWQIRKSAAIRDG
jgi:MFS family permease